MEQAVIEGARKLIETHKPILYVENDREDKSESLADLLKGLGYQLYWHWDNLYRAENFNGVEENVFSNFASQNLFCIKPGHNITVTGFQPYD